MRGRRAAFVAIFCALFLVVPLPASAGSADDESGLDKYIPTSDLGATGTPGAASLDTKGLGASLTNPGTAFAGFNTIAPERLIDTRTGNGTTARPIGEGETLTVAFAGRGSIPADATAVLMNVTVDAPSRGGFLTVFPAGEAVPGTSNINMPAGKTVPNLVAVRLGGGAVSFYNAFGTSHVIADVTAYTRSDGHFVGLTPGRVLDTRTAIGTSASHKVGASSIINVNVLGQYGVPATGVGAVVLNVTADQPTEPSFVTVWPSGVQMPNASSLNMAPGQTVANLVIAPVGANGQVSFYNERGATNLVADVMGYIPAGAAYSPLTPMRVMDTRTGLGRFGMVGPGQTISLDISEYYPATANIAGVVLNVTAAGPTERSFLTVFPGDAAVPNASNLNTVPGENVPNAVVVRPGYWGDVNIRNDRGFTHVIVDLVGLVPLQNALDAPDDSGGSRVHVIYAHGNDVAPTPGIQDNIRQEVEAMNTWFAMQPGAAPLDFSRTSGVIDVTTYRMANMPNAALLNWDCLRSIPGVYNCESEWFGPLFQLIDDGFGFPYNHRYLVYIAGDRGTVPDDPETGADERQTCGVAAGQFATLFETACGMSVDGWIGNPATVGSAANTELVALHEVFHSLGAVPMCSFNDYGDSGHVADSVFDLMYPAVGGPATFPKIIDVGNNDYFAHNNAGCLDLQDSRYMSNVAG